MKRALLFLALAFSSSAFAGGYVGDYAPGDTVDCNFGTVRPSTGASFTLAGTPAISVYKDNGTTESTTGVTLTADFDTRTGLNHVRITTGSDGTFYSAGSFFEAVITTGTVDSVSVVGQPVCSFSLNKVSALRPTTAARTLDVTSTGEAGLDIANVSTCTGSVPALGIVDCGTAQAATSTTLQIRSAAAFADSELIGATCVITGGSAGVGQARTVTANVSSTDTLTVATWTTTPTGTITYACFGTAASSGSVSIATGGITASSFAAGAIDATAIATDAIGAAEIAADALGASEIATDAIGAAELAASAIGASEIADGGITSAEFGSGAITATVIATDAIGAAEIAADAIGAAEVANATIDAATFAAAAIDASAIATDAIGAAEIAADALGASEIATDAIGAAEIAADAIASSELATTAVTEVWSVTGTEPAAKPVWGTSTMKQVMEWAASWSINKVTQTSSTKTLRNTGDTANVVTCAVSDNGTTFTLSACSP